LPEVRPAILPSIVRAIKRWRRLDRKAVSVILMRNPARRTRRAGRIMDRL
jgi:hypothetical protein